MSGAEKAFGALKSMLLVNEKFDAIHSEMKELSAELRDLAKSHSELGQRVARIEGVMEGYARAFADPRQLPER
ncbi:MAG: hypothetical protein AVDCRST_MAG31-241 [uncultured Sphingomonas sp.]|uniref:Uncharacterized protein n=1 Tax=uncultured Sphingomonas sp. TaxID=158754 RepID=A0A6J4SN71_9SPHN|nr:hypothetical protein [uncultured Sphingomonas sp.]CAA9498902.1 MAG: hypothetical protein AVDCRST_MAG31-241 [uncultured Sphingomonas sp.]